MGRSDLKLTVSGSLSDVILKGVKKMGVEMTEVERRQFERCREASGKSGYFRCKNCRRYQACPALSWNEIKDRRQEYCSFFIPSAAQK